MKLTDGYLRTLALVAYPDSDVRVRVAQEREGLWRAELMVARAGKPGLRNSFPGDTENAARGRLARDIEEAITLVSDDEARDCIEVAGGDFAFVKRYAHTILAIRAEHAAALEIARGEGAKEMQERATEACRDIARELQARADAALESDDIGALDDSENFEELSGVAVDCLRAVRALTARVGEGGAQ